MTEQDPGSQPSQATASPGRRPWGLVVATFLLIFLFVVCNWFRNELSDWLFQFDFAIVNIVTGIVAACLVLGWVIWLWFFSKLEWPLSRLLPILVLSAVIGFVSLFQPVFTGGMRISRWQPRFWGDRVLAESTSNLRPQLMVPAGGDFSQYLGSRRNGVVDNFAVALQSIGKLQRLYRQDIGEGWSGFVARNGYAITMEQRGNHECVTCYEIESGSLAWIWRQARRHQDPLGGPGPRATPTLHDDRVYALGANGMLVCLAADSGNLIWQQDLCELLGIPLQSATDSRGLQVQTEASKVIWGRANSPLIVNELVVVPGGGPLDGKQVSLLAFNRRDGSLVWKAGDDGISYASPVLLELAGRQQVVVVNESTVAGHDPTEGTVLWTFPWAGNSDADANTSQAVAVGSNRLLLSKGYGVGGELIEVAEQSGFSAESVWKNSRVLKTKLTSAIVRGPYAFALSDGILECVDLETGKRVWKKGRFGHGQLLMVGDKLIVHAEDGVLHLVEASADSYQELGEIKTVSGVCWNTFCAYDRYILVRSDIEMACFRVNDVP